MDALTFILILLLVLLFVCFICLFALNKSIAYESEMKKLIDEKNYLKERLNLIYGTAGFKAAQVYDGRLQRLEESVNDLRSKVNTMSRDLGYIRTCRRNGKHTFKDLLDEHYGTKPVVTVEECREEAKQLFNDSLNNYVNLKNLMDDRYVENVKKIDDLESDICRIKGRSIPATNGRIHQAENNITRLEQRVKKLEEK